MTDNKKKLQDYNMALGRELCDKYLDKIPRLKKHSMKVAQLCHDLAQKIIEKNPEFTKLLHPEFLGFLGYVHNIGTFIKRERHELHTIYLLTKKENIPQEIALKTRHGQLVEDYPEDGDEYYPIGLEGIILTYADIIVREDEQRLTMKQRTDEMIELMQRKESVFGDYTSDMIERFKEAIPRYMRYENIINSLI